MITNKQTNLIRQQQKKNHTYTKEKTYVQNKLKH